MRLRLTNAGWSGPAGSSIDQRQMSPPLGRAKADMAAVAAIAVKLGGLMLADGSLEEIEINPVLVRESGAVAVDALIRRE